MSFWATDFLDTLYDDQTASLDIGVRKVCMGTDFPTDTIVTYTYFGTYRLEVWARDEAGNSSHCETILELADNAGICIIGSQLSANVKTEDQKAITGTRVELKGYHCYRDSINLEINIFDSSGINLFYWTPEPGTNYTVRASKVDEPLNGITTYDLYLIARHILGIEALDSPYKLIAADANGDGEVTLADIVLLRQLLLGMVPSLPDLKTWRFIPKEYVFPNPQNPFDPPFPEKIVVPFVPDPFFSYTHQFIGVKIGDVNNSAN
ncbi:MAG: dockerin type I domain-containing protein [Saprospiraceae bacterium]